MTNKLSEEELLRMRPLSIDTKELDQEVHRQSQVEVDRDTFMRAAWDWEHKARELQIRANRLEGQLRSQQIALVIASCVAGISIALAVTGWLR